MRTELFVRLLIPDATAITALRTLKAMPGFEGLGALSRYDYYALESGGDVFAQAAQCDILVNANKHKALRALPGDGAARAAHLLVRDLGDDDALMRRLAGLGLPVTHAQRGVLWTLVARSGDAQALARKAADELLHNQHYQEYELREARR